MIVVLLPAVFCELLIDTCPLSPEGYGDISGSTSLELVVSIVMQITGVLFFASVVGNFAATISQSRAEEQRCVGVTCLDVRC